MREREREREREERDRERERERERERQVSARLCPRTLERRRRHAQAPP